MHITYDKQADAMYIKLNNRSTGVARSINDLVNVYLTSDGKVAGIELLALSQYADKVDSIAQQYDIRKVLEAERAKTS